MKLISGATIENFRSIRSVSLCDVGDFTAFAGLNNTGKSNFLRALNAFFTGDTEPGTAISVETDHHRRPKKTNKKKEICVSLNFSLPAEFRFRNTLEHLEGFLGGRDFRISKTWSLSGALPSYMLNDSEVTAADDRQKVDQLLQLINFRYIPNRVLPVEVVRQEHQALRDVLIRRVNAHGKKGTRGVGGGASAGADDVFETIRQTSGRMIGSLSKRLTQISPDIGTIRLATPESLAEMVFTFGYRLGTDGVEVDDEYQGAGIQGLLMLETLYLIDLDYFQKFGWRQAAVWAIEEPESSLHTSLEAHVAAYLSAIATGHESRLQVLATTHSDMMLQYADRCVIVEKETGETRTLEVTDPHAALERSSRLGVSRWVHPILHHRVDPVIIVDGKYDVPLWEEALKLLKPSRKVWITYLELLKGAGTTGGNTEVLTYIKDSASAIKTRPPHAPVIVVLDWEDLSKIDSFCKLFSPADPFAVFVWPQIDANRKLGKNFHGTERFYSGRVTEAGIDRGAQLGTKRDGTYTVHKDDYGDAKRLMAGVVSDGLDEADLVHARRFITAVLAYAGALT